MGFFGSYPVEGGSGGGGSGTGFTEYGTVALVSGTVTVVNSSVSSGSVFFLSCDAPSGVQGILSIGTISPGTSFVINSTSGSDNSTVSWGFI